MHQAINTLKHSIKIWKISKIYNEKNPGIWCLQETYLKYKDNKKKRMGEEIKKHENGPSYIKRIKKKRKLV